MMDLILWNTLKELILSVIVQKVNFISLIVNLEYVLKAKGFLAWKKKVFFLYLDVLQQQTCSLPQKHQSTTVTCRFLFISESETHLATIRAVN